MLLKDQDIVKLIRKKKYCNFIGMAVTPWHAHGIDVAIDKLTSDGNILSGYIFALTFPTGSRSVFKENFTCSNANIDIIECSLENKSLLKKSINNLFAFFSQRRTENAENIFYVVRPSYPDFNWINIVSNSADNSKAVFISTDEGCGSYLINNDENWVNAMEESLKSKKGIIHKLKVKTFKLISSNRSLFRKSMENKLALVGNLYYWRLLDENNDGSLTINKDISCRYQKIFGILNCSKNITTELFENSIIINMAPSSFAEGTNDADLKVLDLLVPLLRKYDYRVIIKTHPRETNPERYSRFGMIYHESGLSQEIIISKCKIMPKCVISVVSTTLITLHSIFEIPAISLAELYLPMLDDEYKKMGVLNYIKTFCNIADFPKNVGELSYTLEQVLRE